MHPAVRLAGALIALALSACGQPAPDAAPRPAAALAASRRLADPAGILAPRLGPPAFSLNEADVVYDAATLPALEALVRRARRSVLIDYYVFGGPTAARMTDVLLARRQSGVEVRVLLDAKLGRLPELRAECEPIVRRLREGRIDVAFHATKPIPPRVEGQTIDHNKYVVVDDSEALVGSMNLASRFARFHDLMIHLRGPAVRDLAAQHELDWFHATHPEAPATPSAVSAPVEIVAPTPAEGPGQVRVVGTGIGRKTGLSALLPLLAGAKRSIHVQMHELGPGPALDALIAARDRGVAVKILLDPGDVAGFVPVIRRAPRGVANAVAVDALLRAGMDVRLFRVDAELTAAHMKSAVIDGETLFAGSTNWTRGGFEAVAETNLEVRGGRAPRQAEAMFARDWAERSLPAERPSALVLQLGRLYRQTSP